MPALSRRLMDEWWKVLPPSLFFFCAFHLIAFTQALTVQHVGIPLYSFLKITIAALLVGKVVLIADHLPFMNRFPDRPLIWNVVWKTLVYILATTIVRYLEQLVHASIDHGGVAAGNAAVFNSLIWSRFWAVQIWLLVLFFGYTLLRELLQALGRQQVLRMIFLSPKQR
jgi:hypothetical protein